MRILYIYPHPDDESFGPAHVMSKQRRRGHEVCLLTLTRGGATKQRFKYNYSIEEMGEVRYQEMLNVKRVLDLTEMKVLDLPDGGLKEMDPREIERVVITEVERMRPDVIVTYPVHGISGFHDHLVIHAIVKRAFLVLKESKATYLKRLAFLTLSEEEAKRSPSLPLGSSSAEEIDCVVEVDEYDIGRNHQALDCYVTYQDTIERIGIKNLIHSRSSFEIFQENYDPPLSDLFEKLT